jgi:hypothetical protein
MSPRSIAVKLVDRLAAKEAHGGQTSSASPNVSEKLDNRIAARIIFAVWKKIPQ